MAALAVYVSAGCRAEWNVGATKPRMARRVAHAPVEAYRQAKRCGWVLSYRQHDPMLGLPCLAIFLPVDAGEGVASGVGAAG